MSHPLAPSSGYYKPPDGSGGRYLISNPASATVANCVGGAPIGLAGYISTTHGALKIASKWLDVFTPLHGTYGEFHESLLQIYISNANFKMYNMYV